MHFFLSVWVQGRKWKEVTPHLRIRQTSNVWRPLESTVSFHSLYINYTKCKKSALFSGERSERTLYFGLAPPKKNPPPLSFPVCLASSVILFILLVLFFFFPPKANYLFPKMQSIVISSFYEMWWWWRWGEGMPCACMRPRCTFKWCSELSWYYPCVFIISVHPRAFPCVLTNAAP